MTAELIDEPDRKHVLAHLAAYWLSIREVLLRVAFEGNENRCKRILDVLRRDELIKSRTGREGFGPYSFYHLTEKGAGVAGVPPRGRAEVAARSRDVAAHLGTLWFCCMEKRRRHRAEDHDVERLLGPKHPRGIHCVDPDKSNPKLLRIYAPGPKTSVSRMVRQCHELITEASTHRETRSWIESGQYAFVTLVDNTNRRRELRDALQKSSHGGQPLRRR